jgi:hypothetical protein
MRTRRLRLRLWKYEAVWDRLVSDGEGSLHPSRGVRSINVQPGETASAKEQRTQRRFIFLMTERESKKFWNWRKS